MKILITGGAGLVGSHAAEYYTQKGDEVIVLDNLMRSQLFGYDKQSVEYNWNYLQKYPNIKLIKGDVRNAEDIKLALDNGVDAVIHTAGQPGVPLSARIPLEDFSINAFGTLNVLEAVRQICPKAKFVYCSTNKVFGENVDKIKLSESEKRYSYLKKEGVSEKMLIDLTGHTPYGVSKLVGDLYVQEYAKIYGMNTCVFRMSCIYGTRQFGFEDQGWVAWFIIAALTGKPVVIYGNGKQVRDCLYVDDLVKAYDKFIQGDIKSNLFCMGGGKDNTISLLEFIDLIEKLTGARLDYAFQDWRPSDQRVYISDIKKACKKLNWKPEVNIEDGAQRVIDWVKENMEMFQ